VENGTFWCILGAVYADCSNLKLYGLLRCTSTMCSAVIRRWGPLNVTGLEETYSPSPPLDRPAEHCYWAFVDALPAELTVGRSGTEAEVKLNRYWVDM